MAELKEGGMRVNDANKTAFIQASGPIYDEFGSSVAGGKDLIDQALSLAK